MSKDNWIAIGGIIVQSIIAVIGIVMAWYMSKRQIQIMLTQQNPKEKRVGTKIVWEVYVVLISYSISLIVALLCALYFFIYIPFQPRLLMLLVLINAFSAYVDWQVLRRWWRKPRSVTVEA